MVSGLGMKPLGDEIHMCFLAKARPEARLRQGFVGQARNWFRGAS
jgi:hypothetical protein